MSFNKFFALLTVLSISYAAPNPQLTLCPNLHLASNAACCKFFDLRDDLQNNLFSNTCGERVREALRLTFHDAIAFSPTKGGGGADGSIITFANTELQFAANGGNGGVEEFVATLTPFGPKHNVTPGDLIQFAGMLGITNCPGTPRVQFFAGRPDPVAAAPDGLVNLPTDDVDTILARFNDAGFSADELVALLSSHSIAGADTFVGDGGGDPFDSTAHVYDSQFFVDTRLHNPVPGEGRLPTDNLLARDDRTACTWQSFINNEDKMRSAFAAAFLKMSLLGQDQSKLVDCSEVIPHSPGHAQNAFFPGNATINDVDAACTQSPFPSLPQDPAITSLATINEF
ncbi:manganese peroxidase [Fomitiporia mediterranea MF3/22]|uniref:manganese peroxidase n=1 Tax=Fomitiporia mediterranea (strain MF3/22) TaxID=694068 RepID=UPI000440729D|nr:manganese peroxidase [Fomitiporia mediterranea MF3/22]EJD07928.1 manganese peroxidase [Fomitiporia mediterranea MF3/22]